MSLRNTAILSKNIALLITPFICYGRIKGVMSMKRLLEMITQNQILGIILGFLLFIAGTLSRTQFVDNHAIIAFVIPLFFMALGFGFIFTSVFCQENEKALSVFIKSTLAPCAIVIVIVGFEKIGINSPILKAGALFLINIGFFNKEINKALNH